MNNKIIHWNCRGLRVNFNEILLLLANLNPAVLCLQETFLKENDNIKFKVILRITIFIQHVIERLVDHLL